MNSSVPRLTDAFFLFFPKARATAAMMGVAEFIFVVIRLACARYYHAHSSKDSSGAAWGFGDSSTGSAKVKEANRCSDESPVARDTQSWHWCPGGRGVGSR